MSAELRSGQFESDETGHLQTHAAHQELQRKKLRHPISCRRRASIVCSEIMELVQSLYFRQRTLEALALWTGKVARDLFDRRDSQRPTITAAS